MKEDLQYIRQKVGAIYIHSERDLSLKDLALKRIDKLLDKAVKAEGRFYCNWCGEMKPIEERREITDETEFVTWLGCVDCYENKKRLDHVTR